MTDKSSGSGHIDVKLEGGLIHHNYIGDQNEQTIHTMVKENDRLVAELQAKRQPILILSDFSKIGHHDQSARDALRDYLGTRFFERTAVFGLPPTLEITGRLILSIIGKGDRVAIFGSEAEALDWLRDFIRNQ